MDSDDDIRKQLAGDRAEPDPGVDARIRAAARQALAATAEPAENARPPRRPRWYYPASAGIGVAAVMLLAVLVVQQAPDPESDLARFGAERLQQAPEVASFSSEDAERPMARSAPAAPAVPACASGETFLRGATLALCVGAGRITVHAAAQVDCVAPLVLDHAGGAVSLAAADETVVMVDGRPHWRVRCDAGVWHVDSAP